MSPLSLDSFSLPHRLWRPLAASSAAYHAPLAPWHGFLFDYIWKGDGGRQAYLLVDVSWCEIPGSYHPPFIYLIDPFQYTWQQNQLLIHTPTLSTRVQCLCMVPSAFSLTDSIYLGHQHFFLPLPSLKWFYAFVKLLDSLVRVYIPSCNLPTS